MMREGLLRDIRRSLHKAPETAGNEEKTAAAVISHLERAGASKVVTGFAGNAVAAFYEFGGPGPTVALRAELDALPIPEKNEFDYASANPGVSHACGHDGHMAILLGAAYRLGEEMRGGRGRAVLIFQPAEETAAGARDVCGSRFYEELGPDYVFALHNLPGFGLGEIIIKDGTFAIASKGMIARLTGRTAHAGHPEQGKSPVFSMTEMIEELGRLGRRYNSRSEQAIITIIHARLGEIAFGTSPGEAVVMATLRASTDEILDNMGEEAARAVAESAGRHGLEYGIDWVEEFPATINDDGAVKILERAAGKLGLKTVKIEKPFSWTEDFSYFLRKTPGALFGLGAGTGHEPLHGERYDFPDTILQTGVDVFLQLIRELDS